MRWEWLGYPQVVLALWGPLLVVGLWHLQHALGGRRRGPRERFVVAVATCATPLLAIFVPYLPESGLRAALPWRAPLAWGISNGADATPSLAVELALTLASVLPLLSLLVSFAFGVRAAARTAAAVRRLPLRRAGDTWVVTDAAAGAVACTAGLVRPRVLLDERLAGSAHAAAVVAHERAHARFRHPLWILVATCAIRGFWWVPGWRAVVVELNLVAELWADEHARAAVGRGPVAAALAAHLVDTGSGRVRAAAAFVDPTIELTARVHALVEPPVPSSVLRRAAVSSCAVLVVAAVIVLL